MTPEEKRWDSRLRRVYGITRDDWWEQFVTQDGRCAVCRTEPNPDGPRLAVEHCHATGEIRGLVCWRCNTAVAKLHDDAWFASRVAAYLTSPPWRGPQNCLPGRSTTRLRTRQRLARRLATQRQKGGGGGQ